MFGGGLLNAPLVNYYEHATFLTLNHAHTALFGAFGLLGIGLIYFCLRYVAGDGTPSARQLGRWAFWLYNGGLVMWIVLNFFPIGWPQLAAVYEHGLAYARSQAFYDTTLFWQWMRMPGRHRLRGRRLADGVGLPREAAPAAARLYQDLRAGPASARWRTGGRRMTLAAEQSMPRQRHMLTQGFRPFFLAAASGRRRHWRSGSHVHTGMALPSRFDPLAWHIHEMLFGFVMAAVAGFC